MGWWRMLVMVQAGHGHGAVGGGSVCLVAAAIARVAGVPFIG